jgi:hypothetical protein
MKFIRYSHQAIQYIFPLKDNPGEIRTMQFPLLQALSQIESKAIPVTGREGYRVVRCRGSHIF